jgi:hypothetical protein
MVPPALDATRVTPNRIATQCKFTRQDCDQRHAPRGGASGLAKVFWFFFFKKERKKRTSFLEKRSKKLLSGGRVAAGPAHAMRR